MVLTKYKLGDLIELCTEKNHNLKYGVDDVKGISINKIFIETKANMDGVSLKPYTLVKPDCFAYVTITSRNGEKITLAYNNSENTYIVSSSYIVFKIIRKDIILSEYLFMFFNRSEFDRYSRFNSWGSAREAFSWNEMQDIEIDLPPVDVQQKYVNIYKSMLENQKCYETALDDLKLSIDALLDEYKKISSKQSIGDLLEEIDIRNSENKFETAYGVNITKQFMPSVASSIDLHNYKIVNENQFVFSGMQTGRDECIRIALLKNHVPVVVSPAYTVLQVKSDNVLPEFIQMWFSRAEADRLGWFMSDSSVRANLDLSTFFEIKIPIPDIEIQRSIADIYKVYMERKQINEHLKAQIKNICPILIRGAVEDGK